MKEWKLNMPIWVSLLLFVLCIYLVHILRFQYYRISKAEASSFETIVPIALGHGGMGTRSLFYALDTEESVKKCLQYGAKGTEIDIQMTKDGVLILFHDQYLSKAHVNSIPICNRTWKNDLENKRHQSSPFQKSRILRLDEFLSSGIVAPGMFISMDLRIYPAKNKQEDKIYMQGLSAAVSSLLETYKDSFHIIVESRHLELLKSIQKENQDIDLQWLTTNFEEGLKTAKTQGFTILGMHMDEISSEQIKFARQSGIRVCIYGANTWEKNKRALLMKPDYIQSDRIRQLVAISKPLHE